MLDTALLITERLDYVFLLFIRVGALIMSSPIFGRKTMPSNIKIAFSLVLGYLLLVSLPPPAQPLLYTGLLEYVVLIVKELLFGVVLGFVTNLFFSLTFIGGALMDMQIGIGIVNVFDIQNNTQIPMLGNLNNLILLIIFFVVNGHHQLIAMLIRTFSAIPIGQVGFNADIGLVAAEVFSKSFLLGTMTALPILATGLTLEVVMGVLLRTVPQMNMFVVGIPLKLIVGLIMVFITIPMFVAFSNNIFSEMFSSIDRMLGTMMLP